MSDLDSEQKPSRRLWVFAALGALALHIGGVALAVAHLRTDDLDDSLGAPAIEIGLEMTSPHLEATDLPPGPDTDASVASPALAEQKAELKETEEIPEGPRSIAPAQGTGQSAVRMRATWQKELIAHLDKHKRYPAERQQKSAEIVVSFELDRMGHVLSTSIVKGSGDTAFDVAALAMVRRSDPVPMPPPLVADEGLNFTLPVIFRVKNKS
jgi:protein TonB